MSGKTRDPLGSKFMDFYCAIVQMYPANVILVSDNINELAWKNIQQISQKWIHLWDHQLFPYPTRKLKFYLSTRTRVIPRSMKK